MTDASQPMSYESRTSKQPFSVGRSEREPQMTATVGIGAMRIAGRRPVDSRPAGSSSRHPPIPRETHPVKYLLLIHGDATAEAAMTADERRAVMDQHVEFARGLRERGAHV